MSGGILQLVSGGIESLYLTGSPNITMFKIVYRRHTNFSINDHVEKINIKKFGETSRFKFKKIGDCIHKIYLIFDIPEIILQFPSPTLQFIKDLLLTYRVNWTPNSDLTRLIAESDYNSIKQSIISQLQANIILYNNNVTDLMTSVTEYKPVSGLDIRTSLQNIYAQLVIIKNNIYSFSTFPTNLTNLKSPVNSSLNTQIIISLNLLGNSTDTALTTIFGYVNTLINLIVTIDVIPNNYFITFVNTLALITNLSIYVDINLITHSLPPVVTVTTTTSIQNTTMQTALINAFTNSINVILKYLFTFVLKNSYDTLQINGRYLRANFKYITSFYANTQSPGVNLDLFNGLVAYRSDLLSNADQNLTIYKLSDIQNLMTLHFIVNSLSFTNLIPTTITTNPPALPLFPLPKVLTTTIASGLTLNDYYSWEHTLGYDITLGIPDITATYVSTTSKSLTFGGSTNTTIGSYTTIFDNMLFYQALKMAQYIVQQSAKNNTTKSYFDDIINTSFNLYLNTLTITDYTTLDAYLIYQKFFNNLSSTYLYITNDLNTIALNLFDNLLYGIIGNIGQIINVMTFLTNFYFTNSPGTNSVAPTTTTHCVLGFFSTYIQNTDMAYQMQSNVFNTLINSKNASYINSLNALPLVTFPVVSMGTSNIPSASTSIVQNNFTLDIQNAIITMNSNMQNIIMDVRYINYFQEFIIWNLARTGNTIMQSIFAFLPVTIVSTSAFSAQFNSQVCLMNYIPLLTVHDIPQLMYDFLNSGNTDLIFDGATDNNLIISDLLLLLDYRDTTTDNTKKTNKKNLYQQIILAVMLSAPTSSRVIDIAYINQISQNAAFTVAALFRPEGTFYLGVLVNTTITNSDSTTFTYSYYNLTTTGPIVLPIKYIVEYYRTTWYNVAFNYINLQPGATTSWFTQVQTIIDNIVGSFIIDVLPTYSSYAGNGFTMYDVAGGSWPLQSIKVPTYSDAISSIWYKINKQFVRTYNSTINNCLLSSEYYLNNLGSSGSEFFYKFKKINESIFKGTARPTYWTLNNQQIDDPTYSLIYNSIDLPDQPVVSSGYDFYLMTGAQSGSPLNPYAFGMQVAKNMLTILGLIYGNFITYSSLINVQYVQVNATLNQYETSAGIAAQLITGLKSYLGISSTTTSTLTKMMATEQNYITKKISGVKDVINSIVTLFGSPIANKLIPSTSTYISLQRNVQSNLVSWTHTNSLSTIHNALVMFTDQITPIILFGDRISSSLCNNFENIVDVINYIIIKIILSPEIGDKDLTYLINYLGFNPFPTTFKNLNSYLTKIKNNLNKLILQLGVPQSVITTDDTQYTYATNFSTNGSGVNVIFDGSPVDLLIKKKIINSPPEYAWVKELGHKIIKQVDLEIDSQLYDSFTSELLHLDRKIQGDNDHDTGYNELIGNTEEMYTVSSLIRPAKQLIVPLNFWFCKDIGNSLPMVNILYSDIYLYLQTNTLQNLLYMEQGAALMSDPKINAHIMTNYVYLEEDERKKITSSKMEFLIDKYQYGGKFTYGKNDFINSSLSSQLYFTDPTKFIIWTSTIKPLISDPINKIDWFYKGYRTIDQVGVPLVKTVLNTKFFDTNGNITKILPIVTYTPNEHTLNRLVIKHKSSSQIKIIFGGRDRQGFQKVQYYNAIHPYNTKIGSLDFGEFMYSLAYLPLNIQPSGSANMTQVPEFKIIDQFNQQTIDEITANNLIVEMEFWSRSIQVVRIMSGIVGQAFINC